MISRNEFVKRWAAALEAHNGSVFIGAGLSRSAGYPDWRMLLKDIAKELGLDISSEHDLAGVAQYCVNRSAGNRNKLKQAIIDNFPPKSNVPEPLAILARLPLRHVWTTNYDTLIETAWEWERKLADVKSQNTDIGHEVPWAHTIIYKMHGCINHPTDVVIAKDDYELYRRERPAFLQLLTGHLVSMQMLFLGFSFTDPNLSHLFASIRETFGGKGPRHYAIVRKPQRGSGKNAAKYHKVNGIRHTLWIEDLQRYGIECVEVDSYEDINDILRDVELYLARRSVFVSGSFPATLRPDLVVEREFVEETARRIGVEIAKRGKRLVSGYGTVVGSAVIGGALGVVLKEPTPNLDRSLLLRPFPQRTPDGMNEAAFQRSYRDALVRQVGVCIFIAGCKEIDGEIKVGTGVLNEFASARSAGRVCIPIGSTGHAAANVWEAVNKDRKVLAAGIPKALFDALNKKGTPATLAKTVAAILDRLDG